MNVQETLALIEALRAAGVSHFKSQFLEITFGNVPRGTDLPKPVVEPTSGEPKISEELASQKIKEMINTLQMTPEQLADQIFPAGAGL